MQTIHTYGEGGLFAGFLNPLLYFLLSLLHHFLNTGRMDTAIVNQFLQGNTCNLPSNGIKTGNNNRFRSIIDNQVNTSQGFQGSDVAAFPADDPAFHLVVRQIHHGNRSFSHVVCGATLDGRGNNIPGLHVRFIFRLLLHVLNHLGSVVLDIFLHGGKELLLGVFTAESGKSFQLLQLSLVKRVHFLLSSIELGFF